MSLRGGRFSDEAISKSIGIASGTPALVGGAWEEQERPRNDGEYYD
jgi:hypothetical protein